MPTFDFSAPDGKTYSIEGPDGATPEQAFGVLKQHLGGGIDMGDIAKSAAISPVKGLIAGLGSGGDAREMIAAGTSKAAGLIGIDASPEAISKGLKTAAPLMPMAPFMGAPTSKEVRGVVEGATGPLYDAKTPAGKIVGAGGEALTNPVSYLGPGGALLKAGTAFLGGAGGEAAGEAAQGTGFEVPAKLLGGVASAVAGGTAASKIAGAAKPVPIPPALEANVAAQNIGVDLPRAIASDSPITRFMGQVVNKMPGGGPMQEGVTNALKQTGAAVENASKMAGGANDAMAAGQGFQTGVETSFKPTVKARVGAAYDEVGKLVDPNFTRPLDATQGAIADIMARRVASGTDDAGKAVQSVLGGATRPGGLTYEGVKDLRTRVGEMLDTGIFPEGMSQGELRRIYGSLSDDLKATAQAAGGAPAVQAFERANAMHKFVEGWKDNLGKALGTDRSGEGVTAAILRMAADGPTGDLKALSMARAAVPRDVWQDVASTAVSRLGKDAKGEFSPNIFLNDFTKLSDRGKALLFNDVGSGGVLPHLEDIATVSKKFVEAGKLANTSGTAGHNATYTMLGAGAAGLLHGSLMEPVGAITAIVGNNLMARALSSPASAASVARWVRNYDALATAPSSQTMAALNIASRNLANTMNSQFGSKVQPGELMRSIQGPVPARSDNEQQ